VSPDGAGARHLALVKPGAWVLIVGLLCIALILC
jgi:hypothetical protein